MVPILLAGVAVATTVYGAKKIYDAKEDFDVAENYNKKALRIYNNAEEQLNKKKNQTNKGLERLGELKVSVYNDSLKRFVDLFSKIKNVDFNEDLNIGSLDDIDAKDILRMKESIIEFYEIVGGGVAALGAGALAGFGAFGGVGMLATASTGTAIAELSGVAATNATLAWLGGGSLVAGGFGMTGGMVVLGGIVTGPILAVGGATLAKKAEEARHVAYSNLNKAKTAVEQMDAVTVVLDGINDRIYEFVGMLEPLNEDFEQYLTVLRFIVNNNTDYSTYRQEEKQHIMITATIAQTLKNLCDAPILDENGNLVEESKKVLELAAQLTKKIHEV